MEKVRYVLLADGLAIVRSEAVWCDEALLLFAGSFAVRLNRGARGSSYCHDGGLDRGQMIHNGCQVDLCSVFGVVSRMMVRDARVRCAVGPRSILPSLPPLFALSLT